MNKGLQHFVIGRDNEIVAGFSNETDCRGWITSKGPGFTYATLDQVQGRLKEQLLETSN
jgi:hypothetical protein